MRISSKAVIALLGVTVMWGLTFPLIKNAVADIQPTAFVVLRLLVAALVMLPFVWKRLGKTTASLLLGGVILGLLNSLIYVAQSIGLKTTSSANSAFITAFSVIFVPLLSPLFRTGRPTGVDLLAGCFALLGIFILTGASFSNITHGDLWTLGCALFYALFVIFLQRTTKKGHDILLLVFYQIVFAIPLPLILSFTLHAHYVFDRSIWIAVIFCALFATCITFYLQNAFQKYISVSKAVIIYAFEPVFATIFAYIINKERISVDTIIGGVLVFSGFLISEMLPRIRANQGKLLKGEG